MQNNFIKLHVQNEQPHYVNPLLITSVLKIQDKCAVYTMDGKTIYPQETVDEVMKKIKEANDFTITLDKQML
jgi:uncharacterized protein YlzI (FlbEa/FlbD family)